MDDELRAKEKEIEEVQRKIAESNKMYEMHVKRIEERKQR
jgi:hypothetical protein